MSTPNFAAGSAKQSNPASLPHAVGELPLWAPLLPHPARAPQLQRARYRVDGGAETPAAGPVAEVLGGVSDGERKGDGFG